jgi:hypothetical protein
MEDEPMRRRQRGIVFTVVIGCVLALAFAVGTGEGAQKERPALLKVETDKTHYAVGEVPQITLSLQNPNTGPLAVYPSAAWTTVSIAQVRDSGRTDPITPVPQVDYHCLEDLFPLPGIVTLQPNETVRFTFPWISRTWQGLLEVSPHAVGFATCKVARHLLPVPGTYRLVFSYKYNGPRDAPISNTGRKKSKSPPILITLD